MKNKPKIYEYKTLNNVVTRLRDDLSKESGSKVVLLYAFNRTGKTRLSMAFKDKGKKKNKGKADTLYYNAFTEDLFVWNNDLAHDQIRYLKINEQSNFFSGFKGLALEERIHGHLERFAEFNFKIDYDFSVFMSICDLVIEGKEEYSWVKYIYIDDPISSLDENNAITLASDLSNMIKQDLEKSKDGDKGRKYIVSTHHGLFFNILYNEMKKVSSKAYFLHKTKIETYKLQVTDDTPFFHHIEQLCELNQVVKKYEELEKGDSKLEQSSILKTYHFNMLRSVFEKTSIFFGHEDFSYCLKDLPDKELFTRAVNIMSHGRYSIFAPVGMLKENADLFVKIFRSFVDKYSFELPDIFFE